MAATDRILLAVDLTPQARDVAATGILVARAFHAEILLVHTVHELKPLYGGYVGDRPIEELQAEIRSDAEQRLGHFADEVVRPGGLPVREVLLEGIPWQEIVTCARQSEVVLIVLGTQGGPPYEHRVLGSTTDRVLRHAPSPVLVVPPR